MPKKKGRKPQHGSAFKATALAVTAALGVGGYALINYHPHQNNSSETEKEIAAAIEKIRATQVASPWTGRGENRAPITASPFGTAECVGVYFFDGHATLVTVNGKPFAYLPSTFRFAACDAKLLKNLLNS